MKGKLIRSLFAAIIVTVVLTLSAFAGPSGRSGPPALDASLMAFKEIGIWYFLCVAPEYPCRIPPHYQTYGPPPPPCAPPPCGPPPCGPPALPAH